MADHGEGNEMHSCGKAWSTALELTHDIAHREPESISNVVSVDTFAF
jgi:hypothetical protein